MERALARWPGPRLLRRARAPTREPPYPNPQVDSGWCRPAWRLGDPAALRDWLGCAPGSCGPGAGGRLGSPRPFWGTGIEKSNLPGCCECWSDSGKLVRPGIEEAVSKCFSQTGWSTTSPSPPSPVSRFSFILPQRSGQPQSAGLSVYQEPRRPRIVNAWTEEVEELPWSSTSSAGSPGVLRLPRAATLLPGLGRSHHLESSVVQDLEPATPAPSGPTIGKLGWKWPSWGALRWAKEKTQAVAPASEAVSELQ
ncbi:TPA: CRTC1 protein-like [Bos taurus]|nr:TPA: CRTC1 protein-like [Bos taurus]